MLCITDRTFVQIWTRGLGNTSTLSGAIVVGAGVDHTDSIDADQRGDER